MGRVARTGLLFTVLPFVLTALQYGCGDGRLYDERHMSPGYRSGTSDDRYLSNGERGQLQITEVFWAGSVEQVEDGYVHHPGDVFIELRNKHARPIHLTGWQITVRVADGAPEGVWPTVDTAGSPRAELAGEASRFGEPDHYGTFIIPPRENGRPVEVNEYVVVAARRDGAFPDADYYIEDLALPSDHFDITIRDLDNRLIDGAGDAEKNIAAGAWDLVTARSMERVQLIFSNDGNRDASWHAYSLNAWDEPEHSALRAGIAPAYRARTFATPGGPNTPDYSGNTSAGSFE